MRSAEDTILAFIRDYHAWNDRAMERSKASIANSTFDPEAESAVTADYDQLVARFYAPSVVRQSLAYGDRSDHHPDLESIESVQISAGNATVRTRHVGLDDFVAEYEYRLVQVAGEWRIGSLLYLGDDGEY